MSNIPTTKSPHTFAKFTTTQGARIYRLPLEAFHNFWVYAYLVFVDDQIVLIDTGSGSGESNRCLLDGFERVQTEEGLASVLDSLTHILITHGHIDHFGGLPFLIEQTNAKVGIHELDLRNLTNFEERIMVSERRLRDFLIEAGVDAEKREEIVRVYMINKLLSKSVPVDFTYSAINMQLGRFEFLHVPGHSAGHVAIRLDDYIFCGDHVLNGISPHQWPERLTLNMGLGHYLDSLSKFDAWAAEKNVTLVLSGHNEPVSDLSARIQQIKGIHAQRLERALGILSEPHTVAEVSSQLFRKVSGYDILLSVEEAGAHVEYLYQRGLLGIANINEIELGNVPLLYQRLNDPIAEQMRICC